MKSIGQNPKFEESVFVGELNLKDIPITANDIEPILNENVHLSKVIMH